jgi:hypothetical protein
MYASNCCFGEGDGEGLAEGGVGDTVTVTAGEGVPPPHPKTTEIAVKEVQMVASKKSLRRIATLSHEDDGSRLHLESSRRLS